MRNQYDEEHQIEYENYENKEGHSVKLDKKSKKTNLNEKWPQRATIRFDNFSMRYREGLPLVLNSISF